MSETRSKTFIGFWVIAIAALIWNLMGAANFLFQMNPENIALMPDTHRALIEDRAVWTTAGFAAGVFGGVIGAILMMLRRIWAVPAFALSLIGVLVAILPTIGLIRDASLTTADVALMIVMPVFVALILWLYARKIAARGWLR